MDKGKKKILIELTNEQDINITKISKKHNITKSELIRLWCDLLVGIENNVQIIVFDSNNIKILKNLNELFDTQQDDTSSLNIELIYNKKTGVKINADILNKIDFRWRE